MIAANKSKKKSSMLPSFMSAAINKFVFHCCFTPEWKQNKIETMKCCCTFDGSSKHQKITRNAAIVIISSILIKKYFITASNLKGGK